MTNETSEIDSQIERLRNGGTLSEQEVKLLCDKVCNDEKGIISLSTQFMAHGQSLLMRTVTCRGISGFSLGCALMTANNRLHNMLHAIS